MSYDTTLSAAQRDALALRLEQANWYSPAADIRNGISLEAVLSRLRHLEIETGEDSADAAAILTSFSRGELIPDAKALDQLRAFAYPDGDLNSEDGPDAVEISEHVARTLAATGRLPAVDPAEFIVEPHRVCEGGGAA